MSLGRVTPENNITRAKTLALKYRVAVLEGRCPLAERQAEQSARKAQHATRTPSFHAAFDLYLAAHEGGWRNPKHRAQWSELGRDLRLSRPEGSGSRPHRHC